MRHNEETRKPNEVTTHIEEDTQHNLVTSTHYEETVQSNGKQPQEKVVAFHMNLTGAILSFG